MVDDRTAAHRRLDADGKGEEPGDERAQDEQRQRVHEALADFTQDGAAVLEGFQISGEQIAHPVQVLDGEGFVEMERGADTLDVLGLETRIGGIDQAGFSRRQMDDGVGDDGNENQQNDPLPDVSDDEVGH